MSEPVEVKKERKPRVVQPRSLTHAALMEQVHAFAKLPSAVNRDAVLKAMLEHKRYVFGDPEITVL